MTELDRQVVRGESRRRIRRAVAAIDNQVLRGQSRGVGEIFCSGNPDDPANSTCYDTSSSGSGSAGPNIDWNKLLQTSVSGSMNILAETLKPPTLYQTGPNGTTIYRGSPAGAVSNLLGSGLPSAGVTNWLPYLLIGGGLLFALAIAGQQH